MIKYKWADMPKNILTTNNEDKPTLSYSKFFNVSHNPDGQLASKATINGVNAYGYIKNLIHDRYYDTGEDFYADGVDDNFRCKLCGCKHGRYDIAAVARFALRRDVNNTAIIDNVRIKFPSLIDLGSSCMLNHKKLKGRHKRYRDQQHRNAQQLKWLRMAWKSPDYCYLTNAYRKDNGIFMSQMIQRLQNGKLNRIDMIHMITKVFWNARSTDTPIRIYKGIGASPDLQGLENIYKFMQGRSMRSFDDGIEYNRDYIDVPSRYLEKKLINI